MKPKRKISFTFKLLLTRRFDDESPSLNYRFPWHEYLCKFTQISHLHSINSRFSQAVQSFLTTFRWDIVCQTAYHQAGRTQSWRGKKELSLKLKLKLKERCSLFNTKIFMNINSQDKFSIQTLGKRKKKFGFFHRFCFCS